MQQMMFTVENKVEKLLNWCFQFFSQIICFVIIVVIIVVNITEHLYSPQVVAKTKKKKKIQTNKETNSR